MDDDIIKLKEEAEKTQTNAYAPYSDFKVGAALLTPKGNIYSGCNVENGSYGLTVCAERNAIFDMVKNGENKISKIVIIGETDDYLSPCGACRQVIAEFADEDAEVYMFNRNRDYKKVTVEEIIPFAFKFKK